MITSPLATGIDIVDLARTLADEFRPTAAELDRSGSFPTANYARMREAGYLRAPVTVAQPVAGGYRLTGHKYFVSQAPAADLLRVLATDAVTGELLLMLVPTDSPGFAVVDTWDTTGMRATASHDVVLNEVFLPE